MSKELSLSNSFKVEALDQRKLQAGQIIISTLENDSELTFEDKYNVISGESEDLKKQLNKILTMKHVYVEAVQVDKEDEKGNPIVNEETGEVEQIVIPRIIIMTTDGKTYASGGYGIYNSLQRLLQMAVAEGKTDLNLNFEVVQIQTRKNFTTYTLKLHPQKTSKK